LTIPATGTNGANTRFLRFSTSNLQNTVTAISGFLLICHSKYIVLIDFERNGALG